MANENVNSLGYGARFKNAVSNGYTKTKRFVSETYNTAKVKAKEYGGKVKQAYNVGYRSGVNDYPNIPRTIGAHTSATVGYSKGLKDTHKNYKYQNKIKK